MVASRIPIGARVDDGLSTGVVIGSFLDRPNVRVRWDTPAGRSSHSWTTASELTVVANRPDAPTRRSNVQAIQSSLDIFGPAGSVRTPSPVPAAAPLIPLRDYQRAAVEAITGAFAGGTQRPMLVLPTGGGKTVVFSEIIRRRLSEGRAAIIAHRDELIEQAADKLRMVAGSLDIGVVKAERNQLDADVVVASIQSLVQPKRLALAGRFATVVVDEAHHSTARTYRTVLEALGSGKADGPLILGVTATPDRGDGIGLDNVFDEIVFEVKLLDLIAQGYLCDVVAERVQVPIDFKRVRTSSGDYNLGDLEREMIDADAERIIAEAVAERASDRQCIVVFTPTVVTAHRLADALNAVGIPADSVDGETPTDERRATLRKLADGELRAVVNCNVLSEGFDLPRVDCIVMASPTKSRSRYQQQVGRGFRTAPNKRDCLVIDLVGVTADHKLQSIADLCGLPLGKDEQRDSTPTGDHPRTSLIDLLRSYGGVVDAESGKVVAVKVDLFENSWARWLHGGDGVWILPAGDATFLLTPKDGHYDVLLTRKDGTKRTVGVGIDQGYAQGVAEDMAKKVGVVGLADKSAGWRGGGVTPNQEWKLRSLGLDPSLFRTRGDASDAITIALARQGVRR